VKHDLVTDTAEQPLPALVSVSKWAAQVGICVTTAWRWRRLGWLRTTNICGRQYLTDAALREFAQRAARGEFASEHKVPKKEKAVA